MVKIGSGWRSLKMIADLWNRLLLMVVASGKHTGVIALKVDNDVR